MEQKIYTFLAFPEIGFAVCMIIPPARRWVLKMIEDSDGDPNHVDGFFVMIIYAASLCIRTAVWIAINDVFHDREHFNYVVMFLAYSVLLLGVRVFRSKLNLDALIKKE